MFAFIPFSDIIRAEKLGEATMNLTVQLKLQPTKEQGQWLTTTATAYRDLRPVPVGVEINTTIHLLP